MGIAEKHRRYLRDEFFGLVLSATVQRAGIYSSDAKQSDRELFRGGLRKALHRLAAQYGNPVSDAVHCRNIQSLADQISSNHGAALRGKRFRIGPAQKALNLYLKYEWCADWIPAPPHCPFDAVILSRVPRMRDVRWTRMDTIREYQDMVSAAREQAMGASLADWELELYDKRSVGSKRTVNE